MSLAAMRQPAPMSVNARVRRVISSSRSVEEMPPLPVCPPTPRQRRAGPPSPRLRRTGPAAALAFGGAGLLFGGRRGGRLARNLAVFRQQHLAAQPNLPGRVDVDDLYQDLLTLFQLVADVL